MPVAQVGLAQALSTLWDSRRQLPGIWEGPEQAFFPRVYLKLWVQPTTRPANATLPVVE